MGENDIERGMTHTHLLFHLQQPNVVWKKSPVLDGCSLAEKCMEKRKKALYNLTCVIKGFVILQAAAVSIFTNVHKFGLPLYKKYK